MAANLNWIAIAVFGFFFALVTVVGFLATQWKPALDINHIDQWALGGRQFGAWIIWFLIGGDFYTAYMMIAVPAVAYLRGAYGFFAVPYGILAYPIVFLIMPALWTAASRAGHVTAGDIVFEHHEFRPLELAVALTGVLATMPYLALQLIGMRVVIQDLGLPGEAPLVIAFSVLAFYTYSSGLRAPALIAFVKDIMIFVVVLILLAIIPIKLGGFGAVFAAANKAFLAKGPGSEAGLFLRPGELLPYATLALGSALAAFMYPHTLTAVLAAKSEDVIKRNAVFLPVYTALVAFIALAGYMAHALGLSLGDARANEVLPQVVQKLLPNWAVGFVFAAVAVGALAPAAIMSIGSANLFARNFWTAYVDPTATAAEEARVAKIASLLIKLGALLFIILLPLRFAINLQLLGGLWILQIFPAVVFGLFTKWFRGPALLLGWAIGFFGGTALTIFDGLSPLHEIAPGYSVYIGLLALAANIATSALGSAFLNVTDRRLRTA